MNKNKCKSINSNRTQNPQIETIILGFRQYMHEKEEYFNVGIIKITDFPFLA